MIPILLLHAAVALGLPEVTLFESTQGAQGNVRVVDEQGMLPDRLPQSLQGIELLPFVQRHHAMRVPHTHRTAPQNRLLQAQSP